ncbi:hypothetical protein [uncultured Marivita sp.]|uniref:hypothetical protein n=1 Tax=uncultured Marivita sp. TaxID=888080 RepID=UPI002607179E|nr:hypothetical protein [uncultured Marivita sp.]
MPIKTYTIATNRAETEPRKGHIVSFAREGQTPVDVALYKTSGGYAADHPRTGYAIRAFDQISRMGPPVPFKAAKESLLFMLDDMEGYERIREGCRALPVLNPDFR